MADNNLPDQTPAPDGAAPQTPPSEPSTKPADAKPEGANAQTPASPFDSLSEDQKKYLKGQGIEDLTPEALTKIINHAQSSQKTASELKNKLDAVNSSLNPSATPTDPSGQPQTDTAPKPTGDGGLDPVQAYTLSSSLATSYPELKDDLVSGKIYTDMQALGIPLTVNGSVNLAGITSYAKLAQERAQYEAKLEEMNKPGEGAIPDANPTTPQQPAADAEMTHDMALAILSQDPNHARAAEAKQFLQSGIGKK